MAYSQGGLIEATDYNNFINGSNQLNTVWGVGSAGAGYGQTPISTVIAGELVTATQWAALINTLNSTRLHQTGSGSGISAVSAGQTVNYLSTLSTAINSAYTDRATFNSTRGSTATGTDRDGTWNTTTPTTFQQVRTVTFDDADKMRYFFNAGGRINLTLSVVGGTDNSKESAWTDLIGNGVGTVSLDYDTSTRSGSGYTLTTDGFANGFWDLTTSDTTIFRLTDTVTAYNTNYVELLVKVTGTAGSNGGKGTVITFTINYNDQSADTVFEVDQTAATATDYINMTMRTRIDVIKPEASNLTDVWGTIAEAATVN